MIEITLKCCTCGDKKRVFVEQAPIFAFQFAQIASGAEWYPVADLRYNRSLCFCSKECADKQRKKKGGFRKRLIHCPKKVLDTKK